MRYVIICSVGRAGTTLLQGILNSLDGYCIRGENRNFLFGLHKAHEAIRLSRSQLSGEGSPGHPWYGAGKLDPDRFLSDARAMFLNQMALPPDITVTGFKEIRWTRSCLPGTNLGNYLDFISQMLGDVRFLFLTRDLSEIIDSRKRVNFGNSPIDEQEIIRSTEEFHGDMRAVRVPTFEIDYRDIVDTTPRLRAMFAFLGAEYDEDRLDAVLSVPHSYGQSSRSLEDLKARAAARRSGRDEGPALAR